MKNSGEPRYLQSFISKMKKQGIQPIVIDTFAYYYEKVAAGERGFIYDKNIIIHLNKILNNINL